MKKFINKPENVENEMLDEMCIRDRDMCAPIFNIYISPNCFIY